MSSLIINNCFNLQQTNIAKGVALLLLLWHHLFYNNPDNYELYNSVFVINGVPVECLLSNLCKVCVAIFLILSGYGLFKSYDSYCTKLSENRGGTISLADTFRYLKNRLIKLYSDYWFIFIIFVPMGLLFGRSFLYYYGKYPLNYFADFFGVSYLFHNNLNYTFNATWWYMSICIVYYMLFPIIYKCFKKYAEAILMFSFLLIFIPIDYAQLTTWLFPFVIGMYFAKYNLFEKISLLLNNYINKILTCILFVVILAYFRWFVVKNSVSLDGIFGLSIILFTYLIVSRIPIINTILGELGKYSGMIFMFHTFMFSYYFKEFIYGFKYSFLIYAVFVLICYIVARLIKLLQKLIRYDKFINTLLKVNNEKASNNRCE